MQEINNFHRPKLRPPIYVSIYIYLWTAIRKNVQHKNKFQQRINPQKKLRLESFQNIRPPFYKATFLFPSHNFNIKRNNNE